METHLQIAPAAPAAQPLCPVFGVCGGCAYQDLPYEEELERKKEYLVNLFRNQLPASADLIEEVVPSPEPYHYRHRLDIAVRKTKSGEFLLGFQEADRHRMVPIESCAIAREEISDFIPELKKEAQARWPEGYRIANLVVKTGADGRVVWGGIGRRSLALKKEDYLWTEIRGKNIFYSLDTFFQANLSILPALMDRIDALAALDAKTLFFDLYAGVGLFGIVFADRVGKVVMVEEGTSSIELARYNTAYHALPYVEILPEKVENVLPLYLHTAQWERRVALLDPPRKGLSPEALECLIRSKNLTSLFYLSCSPESLCRDLRVFHEGGWSIETIVPFDFFPKTRHLETLVLLKP